LLDSEFVLGLLAILLVIGDRLGGASGKWTEMLGGWKVLFQGIGGMNRLIRGSRVTAGVF
jgi:hypothetical protein